MKEDVFTNGQYVYTKTPDQFEMDSDKICAIPGCGVVLFEPWKDLCGKLWHIYNPEGIKPPLFPDWLKDHIEENRKYYDRERKRKRINHDWVDKLEDSERQEDNYDGVDKSPEDEDASQVKGLRAITQQAIEGAADFWHHNEDTLRHLTPEEKAEEVARNIAFQKTLDELPTDDDRRIFFLYSKSMTQAEIGKMLEVEQGTISRRLAKARKILKSKIEQAKKELNPEPDQGGRRVINGQTVPKKYKVEIHRTATGEDVHKWQDQFLIGYVGVQQPTPRERTADMDNLSFDGFTQLMDEMDTAKGEEALVLAQKARVRANTLLLAAKWNDQTKRFELAQAIRIRAHTLLLAAQMLELEYEFEQENQPPKTPSEI